ncbi:MAG TPA: GIY-YIG nuclease family protein [Candidatus Acidoferrum sp.]|nr:GIY-YIG nuclease family protein [Candidatus Acidoferrum sp.]
MEKDRRRELTASYKASDAKKAGGVCAITNTVTGSRLLMATRDIKGAENRFLFSQATNSCSYLKLAEEWKQYGPQAFKFEVFETIRQKEGETPAEFAAEVDALLEMYENK